MRRPRRRGGGAAARRGRPGDATTGGSACPGSLVEWALSVARRVGDPARPVRDAAPRARGRQRRLRARLGLHAHHRPPHRRAAAGGARGRRRRPDPRRCAAEHGLRDVDVPALGRAAGPGGSPPDGAHAAPHDQAAGRGHLRRRRDGRRDRDGRGGRRGRGRPARAADHRLLHQRHPRPRPQRRLGAQAAPARRARPAGALDPGHLRRHHRPGDDGRQHRAQQRRACWSGLVLANLVREGTPVVIPGFGGEGLDLRTMVDPYAEPDSLGPPARRSPTTTACRCSRSPAAATARSVDEQAATDAALTMLGNALAGGPPDPRQRVPGVGAHRARSRSSRSATRSPPGSGPPSRRWSSTTASLALDLIDELGPDGSFLEAQHTLDHYRERWYPSLIDRQGRSAWAARGGRTLGERAAARVTKLLATHQAPPLPEAAEQAISAILERAAATPRSAPVP